MIRTRGAKGDRRSRRITPGPRIRGGRNAGLQSIIGIDLGDKSSRYCVLVGDELREGSVATTKQAVLDARRALINTARGW